MKVRHVTHVLIMGDFNCPAIDYGGGYVQAGGTTFDTEFFDKTSDLLLVQNIFEYTRIRSGCIPSKLDYVFTEEEHLVEAVHYEAPLGKRDHVVLTWSLVVEPKERKFSNDNRYNYWKGNYDNMIKELQTVDWQQEFSGRDVNDMWLVFRDKLQNAVVNHVPVSRVKEKQRSNTRLRKKTLKKIRIRNAS